MTLSFTIDNIHKSELPLLLPLWESSVRASHHFLGKEDIAFFKKMIIENEVFAHFHEKEHLYVARNEMGKILGFIGVSGTALEMLFLDPTFFGLGIGTFLVNFVIQKHKVSKVEVNEQNVQGVLFYKKMGFKVVGRTETDPSGKPFPHLIMEI
ncbi:MAG: GNAT family N-acetyltransferase [Saprospiraceae bacterium]